MRQAVGRRMLLVATAVAMVFALPVFGLAWLALLPGRAVQRWRAAAGRPSPGAP
ncbi:MAG: hypothetical protein ACP5G2_01720 [Candidatus Bipolaricaulaceae bacterium]